MSGQLPQRGVCKYAPSHLENPFLSVVVPFSLAGALVTSKRLEEAADQFRELVSLLERNPSVMKLVPVDLLVPALQQYVQVLRTLGRYDDAAAVESKITDSSDSRKLCRLLLTTSVKSDVQ